MASLTMSMFSEILQMDVNVSVLLPEQRKKGQISDAGREEYPVLYVLHGYGDDHTAWMRKSILETIARDYKVIVVMPAGLNGFYVDHENGNLYFTYLSEELPQKMAAFFHVTTEPGRNYVMGNSMGGYGAIHYALACPERFAGAASLSGALMPYEVEESKTADPFLEFFRANRCRALGTKQEFLNSCKNLQVLLQKLDGCEVRTKFYICCGTDDAVTWAQYEAFKRYVEQSGIPLDITWSCAPGAHNWQYWNQQIEKVFQIFQLEKIDP